MNQSLYAYQWQFERKIRQKIQIDQTCPTHIFTIEDYSAFTIFYYRGSYRYRYK